MPEGIHYGRSLTSNQTSALLHACARHVYVSSAISFPICVRVWKGMSRATISRLNERPFRGTHAQLSAHQLRPKNINVPNDGQENEVQTTIIILRVAAFTGRRPGVVTHDGIVLPTPLSVDGSTIRLG